MIGQHGIKRAMSAPPIRYEAVDKCLDTVGGKAIETNASIHMPRIGCGLAGGRWEVIESYIQKHLVQRGIEVYVYDFK